MNQQLWVEPVGDIVLARMRGRCDVETIKEIHQRVFELVKDTHQVKVLYDGLEMEDPTVDMAVLQQKMDAEAWEQHGPILLRRAILRVSLIWLESLLGNSAKARTESSITTWRRQSYG